MTFHTAKVLSTLDSLLVLSGDPRTSAWLESIRQKLESGPSPLERFGVYREIREGTSGIGMGAVFDIGFSDRSPEAEVEAQREWYMLFKRLARQSRAVPSWLGL